MATTKISEIITLLDAITNETLVAVAENDGSGNYVTKKVDLRILENVKVCASFGDFPAEGAADTIYIAKDTRNLYIWDSSGGTYLRVAADADMLDGEDGAFYRDGDNIIYDNAGSGLSATNIQDAIDELDSNIDAHASNKDNPHEVDAAQVAYDNTTSGLSATTVQAAIDELNDSVGSGGGSGASAASEVSYDNTNSELSATNVQAAIDEVLSTYRLSKPNVSASDIDENSTGTHTIENYDSEATYEIVSYDSLIINITVDGNSINITTGSIEDGQDHSVSYVLRVLKLGYLYNEVAVTFTVLSEKDVIAIERESYEDNIDTLYNGDLIVY